MDSIHFDETFQFHGKMRLYKPKAAPRRRELLLIVIFLRNLFHTCW